LISSRFLDAEVRRQVDHLDAGRQQLGRLGHRHAMRGGEEHHVALLQVGLVRAREGDVDATAQRRKHIGHRQAVFLARGDRGQLHIRMNGQQPQQFHARVSGSADDANFNHVFSFNNGKKALPRTRLHFNSLCMRALYLSRACLSRRGEADGDAWQAWTRREEAAWRAMQRRATQPTLVRRASSDSRLLRQAHAKKPPNLAADGFSGPAPEGAEEDD